MKNILIALFLFGATGSSQLYDLANEEYGNLLMFLPQNTVVVKSLNLPQKHIGTFTYFVIWDVEFGYCKVIVTANVY